MAREERLPFSEKEQPREKSPTPRERLPVEELSPKKDELALSCESNPNGWTFRAKSAQGQELMIQERGELGGIGALCFGLYENGIENMFDVVLSETGIKRTDEVQVKILRLNDGTKVTLWGTGMEYDKKAIIELADKARGQLETMSVMKARNIPVDPVLMENYDEIHQCLTALTRKAQL